MYGSQLADPYHDGKTSATTQTPQIQEAFVLKDIMGNQLHGEMPSYGAIRSIARKRMEDRHCILRKTATKSILWLFNIPLTHLLFVRPDKIEQADLRLLNECIK